MAATGLKIAIFEIERLSLLLSAAMNWVGIGIGRKVDLLCLHKKVRRGIGIIHVSKYNVPKNHSHPQKQL